ncbi:ribosome recycling factor [Ferruginivarius sediminum]|uniref:Ribosome-recycling factor n=2 Tax=Ferruginivarius sediminum TaxID=2661937 RepID=A0A369T9Z0_9PROT|nr:ribosome recycling factor [Ferruginivarius sediminum]
MSETADFADLQRRMDGALEALKREFQGLRTGRAHSSLLEPVKVKAYGTEMPLNQVATVSAPESRMLSVQVWDRSLASSVEKAIRDAGLGLNPQAEGQVIRVPIPQLSEERRQEMSKVASKYAEQARVAVRNVRRDGMEALKKQQKDGDISEDEQKRLSDQLQKLTDDHIKAIDEHLEHKEQEIMQV